MATQLETKQCKFCKETFSRKRYVSNGKLEAPKRFDKRANCSDCESTARQQIRKERRSCVSCFKQMKYSISENVSYKMCKECYIEVLKKRLSQNKKPDNNCIECSKKLSDRKRVFCRSCSHKLERNHKWKGGISQESFRLARKQRKEANGGTHTSSEWKKLKEKFGNMCLCCKQDEPAIKLTKDHIIPVSKGGRDDIQNIQPLCMSCNMKKYNLDQIDYRILINKNI